LLGCLLIVASISMFELAAHSSHYALTLTVTPFLGALYLGLPYLLYTVLYQQRRYAPVPAEQVRTVFLLGMISAIPSLVAGRVFFAPCFWLLITLVTVWRWGRWDRFWDGLTYLLALGLGFAVYYTYPLFVPIPILARFLNQLVLFELSYTAQNIPPWDPRW
jgi:RsiW-degrading membrane proteinase PrsW (M82 family)